MKLYVISALPVPWRQAGKEKSTQISKREADNVIKQARNHTDGGYNAVYGLKVVEDIGAGSAATI